MCSRDVSDPVSEPYLLFIMMKRYQRTKTSMCPL
jgi:hypothetical protein